MEASFSNRYDYYEPQATFSMKRKSKKPDEGVSQNAQTQISVEDAWVGSVSGSKIVSVLSEPSPMLRKEVLSMLVKSAATKGVSKPEVVSVLRKAPAYVAGCILNGFTQISKKNKALLLEVIADSAYEGQGHRVLREVFIFYSKNRRLLDSKEAWILYRPMQEAAKSGIDTHDHKLSYRFTSKFGAKVLSLRPPPLLSKTGI